MLLFSTNTNPSLASELCKSSKFKKGKVEFTKFSNNEIIIQVKENVKGKNIFVLGSTFPPVENIMHLLQLVNALKENNAKKITVIIPHYGYARQNHPFYSGEPLTSKLLAQFLKISGATKIITIDLHDLENNIQFFTCPLKNISAMKVLAKEFKNIKNTVIASPDIGAEDICQEFSKHLHSEPVIVLSKYRPKPNVVQKTVAKKFKDVQGKNVILVDDMINTAGTIAKAIEFLKTHGAKDIYIAATHPVLSGSGIKRLKKSNAKKIVFTNTIPFPKEKKLPNMKIISVGELILDNT